ncbi:MAG: hypothetical protein JW765_04060 [Deltaproteobacteria bacterium]|nr:hypothetical protein [Candidatus Zymogenaceae bacterium]
MKISDILGEVGRERGLLVREDGALSGMISDFPVLIRSIPHGNLSAVSITVRTGPGDFAALKKAVKGVKGMKPSMLKSPGADSLQYIVPYTSFFMGRTRGTVIAAVDSLMPLTGGHFKPPPKACEVCGRPDVSDVLEKGGRPALICPGCAETIRAKQDAARMAYESTNPDYLKGIILGLVGAAAGAVVWAAVIILFKSTYLLLSAGIGVMVAFFVKKAMGRVDRAGYVIAAVLVLASIFAGEVLSYFWLIGRATGRPDLSMAYHAYMNILINNPRNLIYTVLFALTGVWIGVASLSKMESNTKREEIE